MRKAVTSLPAISIGLIAAKGKFSSDQGRPDLRPPSAASSRAFGPQMPMVTYFSDDVGDGDVEAFVLRDAPHVVEVARAGIGAVDHAAAVGHAEDGEVGAHHALVVEEVGVDALADIGVAADLGRAQPFHQLDMVGPFDVEHGEMRQVDDAAILAHRQMLGIGDAPEMAVVPFVLAHRNAVAVFLQQMLVGGVAMGALPAAQLHEIAAEFLLALVEGRAPDVAARGIGLARMHGRDCRSSAPPRRSGPR